MRIGSLFSGAGGLDLAVEAMFGAHVIWQCEHDDAASKVLAHHWPGVPNLGDITAVDWNALAPVDILCGGFPCQDVSSAGRRAGIKDGTRSGLWSYFAEAVAALRPRFVVIENVRGLLSAKAHRGMERSEATVGVGQPDAVLRAAGAVLGDLADLGYDAQWTTVSAASVGAPHKRERVFILAVADADYAADDGQRSCPQPGDRDQEPVDLLPTPTARDHKGRANAPGRVRDGRLRTTGHDTLPDAVHDLLPTPNASDASGGGTHPDNREGHSRQLIDYALLNGTERWGKYGPAIERWEALTRPAPPPTEPNTKGNPRLAARFAEWMQGWPDGWCTDPAIGISRKDQLRIVGNGVCPQQAIAAQVRLLSVCGVAA